MERAQIASGPLEEQATGGGLYGPHPRTAAFEQVEGTTASLEKYKCTGTANSLALVTRLSFGDAMEQI